jgi:hypothetical protein
VMAFEPLRAAAELGAAFKVSKGLVWIHVGA